MCLRCSDQKLSVHCLEVDVLNEVAIVLLLHRCLVGEPPVPVGDWGEEAGEGRGRGDRA